MKVKIFYQTIAEKVVEISDEFLPIRGDLNEVTDEFFDDAIRAVEKVSGMPFGDDLTEDTFIVAVEDAETGETLMEW